jgi:hypothetical protein
MGLFSKKPPVLPSYQGVGLDQLLADPVWAGPIRQAGFDVARCDFVEKVDSVLVAARGQYFKGGRSFLSARPAIVLAQGPTLGLAVPDERSVLVITRQASQGRLMLTRFDAIQVVFGHDASVDGWTFDDLKITDPEGKAFGDALNRFVVSG